MSSTGFSSSKWLKRGLWTVVTVYLIYLVFGFFVLPGLVKGIAEGDVAETLDREVRLGQVSFNPFSLRLELQELVVEDDLGGPLLEVEDVVVNAELLSAFLLQPVIKEFSVTGAHANVKVAEDGSLNIERLMSLGGTEGDSEESDSSGFGFRLDLLELADVSLSFKDLSKEKPFEELVGPLNLEARDLVFEPDSSLSPHAFVAKIGEHTTIEWEGEASLIPLSSKGRFALTNLQISKGESYWSEMVGMEASGLVSLDIPYEALMGDEGLELKSEGLKLSLVDFEANIPDSEDLIFKAPALELEARFDLAAQEAQVDRVTGSDLYLLATRDAKGEIVLPAFQVSENERTSDAPIEEETNPWTIVGENVSIAFRNIVLRDRSIEKASEIEVSGLEIRTEAFSLNEESQSVDVSLSGTLGSKGAFSLKSDIDLASMRVDFESKLETLSLTDFAPYVAAYSNANLISSELSGNAKGTLDAAGEIVLDFAGSLDSFEVGIAKETGSISEFKSFRIEGGHFDGERVKLDQLLVVNPVFRLSLEEGGVNMLRLLLDTESEVEAVIEESVNEEMEGVSELPMQVEVGKVAIQEGRIEFLDKTLNQAFSSLVSNLNFETIGLNTAGGKVATMATQANIDSGSTFKLEGRLKPSDPEDDTNIAFAIDGYDLTATSPYWRKYLGRDIAKGQLFVSGEYSVKKQQLTGLNHLKIEGLALGEKVESEDSLGLPIGLAVALLGDKNGTVQLKDITITQSLENSEVGVGNLIGQAIGIAIRNIVAKAATAPFSLLGNLAGGRKDLDTVGFGLSQYQLSEDAIAKLDDMAKVLNERPLLKIEITSSLDRKSELAGFLEPLRDFKLQEMISGAAEGSGRSAGIDPISLLRNFDKDRYQRNLSTAYRENQLYGDPLTEEAGEGDGLVDQFASLLGLGGKESPSGNLAVAMIKVAAEKEISKGGSLAELQATFGEMTNWLSSAQPEWKVDESWLEVLADERARSARRYLLEEKGIAPERVFIKKVVGGNSKESFLKLKPVN